MENRNINMKENWVKWNPTLVPEGEYVVTDFVQNREGTKIILDDGQNVIEILFDGILPIVRYSVEGIRMRTWGEVQRKYGNKYFFRGWFLYKIENSELSRWAEEESCGFYNSEQLTHFSIVTSEEIIDILATFEPMITFKPIINAE